MLFDTATINARAWAEHVQQKKHSKRQEVTQVIEFERLALIDYHRVQHHGVTGVFAGYLDAKVLDSTRAFQIQVLALLAVG